MIIKMLLQLCLKLLTSLLSNVGSIPDIPEGVLSILQTGLQYILAGVDLLAMLLGTTAVNFMGICLDVIIAANLFYMGYSVVMWFIKKIPFFGIK